MVKIVSEEEHLECQSYAGEVSGINITNSRILTAKIVAA